MEEMYIKAACFDRDDFIKKNVDSFEISNDFIFFNSIEELFLNHRSRVFDALFIVLKENEHIENLKDLIDDLDSVTLLFVITEAEYMIGLDKTIKERTDSFIMMSNFKRRENKYEDIIQKVRMSCTYKVNYEEFLHSEMESRKSSEKKLMILSKLLEEIPLGVIISDLEGNIEYANSKYLTINAYDYEELIDKKWWDIGIEDKIKKIMKLLSEGRSWNGTFLSRRKNGEIFWESSSFYSISDYEGNIVNYIGISEDVTLKMELQKEIIEAKNKAEMGAKAKSIFLANMSHEIRTPLSAIVMLSDMLRESKLSEDDAKMIKLLSNSAHSLLGIINDVLDFSKLDAQKIELDEDSFDIRDFVKVQVDVLGVMADENHLYLNCEIDDKIPDFVKGDRKRLGQVLNNLIGNAIKFTQKGGVTVSLKLVEETEKNVFLEFKVSDTGVGISQEELHHIFEEFYQVETSYTKKIKGTGLGLVIARKLVRMMGGDVSVESREGRGSDFIFDIRLGKLVE